MKEPKQAHVVAYVLEHVEQIRNSRAAPDVSANDPGTGAVRDSGDGGFTRLTIRGSSHTLLRHAAGEADYERLQAPCPRNFQLRAATQV